MLTDVGDLVIDPFGGSCVTGEVCERLERKWVCIDTCKEYLDGSSARFDKIDNSQESKSKKGDMISYRIPKPGFLWESQTSENLKPDGGKER